MHRPEPVPWAGFAALSAAVVISVPLLSHLSGQALLNTWYLNRSSGLVAYAFLWLSTCIGLLQTTGLLKGLVSAGATMGLHQFTAISGLSLATFHGVILLWDQYVAFTWESLLIPFRSSYQPFLVGLGTLAFYLALTAAVSSYVRGGLSPRAWRILHLSSLAAFTFALIHGTLLGTDAADPVISYLYRFTGISTAMLLGYRIYNVARQGWSRRHGTQEQTG